MCTCFQHPQARPQCSSPGPFSAWPPGFHSCSHLSTPFSWWVTYPNVSVSQGPEEVSGRPAELRSIPTHVHLGVLLNLPEPCVLCEGGWLCPLQRVVAMKPVATLILAAPTTSPCRDWLRPLSSLQKCPHAPNLHILLYSTPVPSGPGTGDTVMPPTPSSVCFPGWVQKAGWAPLFTNDYQMQPGAQLSSQTRQAVGARVGKGRGGVEERQVT